MRLLFVTHNTHKLEEIEAIVGEGVEIISLSKIGFFDEIPENNDTIEENALEKARTLHNLISLNCFADDTGLEIEALGGAPGVFSARYAGEEHDSKANMKKVLKEMEGVTNRKARFRTVIALIWNHHEYLFEGIVNGTILTKEQGEEGFGYDPIFQPDGYTQSFAELSSTEKNRISHRGEAVNKLMKFLELAKTQ